MILAGAMAAIGFLANDFVEQRDQDTAGMEQRLTSQLVTLRDDVRALDQTVSDDIKAMQERVGALEGSQLATSREIQALSARVERLAVMIRERTLDRMQ